MPKKELKFEQALSLLTNIVEVIEDGDTTLDAAIKLYKEGLTLAQNCSDNLGHYESEVQKLQREANESFTLVPFDEGVKTHE